MPPSPGPQTQLLVPTLLPTNNKTSKSAAGGLRPEVMRQVVLAKIKIFITKWEIRAEYVFFNEAPWDVVTEMTFPIPDYGLHPESTPFNTFTARVDGRLQHFRTHVQAWADGSEWTELLREVGVDIATFAGIQRTPGSIHFPSQICQLSEPVLERLIRAGVIDGDGIPRWTVRKTCHWTQSFPSRAAVRISHTYGPHGGVPKEGHPPTSRVRVLLGTTAAWKTPIGEFHLEVQGDPKDTICFSWDGARSAPAIGRMVAAAVNVQPKSELTVHFLDPAMVNSA